MILMFVLFLLAVVPMVYFSSKADDEFNADCRKHGGVPVINRSGRLCYAAGTIIEVR